MNTIPQDNPKHKYYVYTLARPDGTIFYIGKGHQDRRMDQHEIQARRGVKSHKCNVIRKIWHEGGSVIKKKVAEFIEEQDAFIYEWYLINLIYGRENLTNATDGGDGASGWTPDESFRERVSKQWKGRVFSSETLALISEASRGRKLPSDAIERIAASHRGKKQSVEVIEKRRKSMKGRKPSQNTIDAARIAN